MRQAAFLAWGTGDGRKGLSFLIEEAVEPFNDLSDWVHKADIERQLRQQVKRRLPAAQCPPDRVGFPKTVTNGE